MPAGSAPSRHSIAEPVRRYRSHRPTGDHETTKATAERGGLLGPVAVQLPVAPLGVQQLLVGALLDDLAVLHDQDERRRARMSTAGGRRRSRCARRPAGAGPARYALGVDVDVRGGLVEDEDAGVGGQGAGERDELALPGRQLDAALADLGVVALGQRLMNSSAPTARAASRTCSSVASGRPNAMFSRTLPLNRKPSWGTIPIWERSECAVTSRRSWPSTSTAPEVGS